MNKERQLYHNELVLNAYNKSRDEYLKSTIVDTHQLRTCSATVIETAGWYYLRSYNTIVAVIPKCTNICYDILRLVHGYTATSAQHINKFMKDYGVDTKITWRPVRND